MARFQADEDVWIVIFPVDGYGNQEIVRSVVWNEKPDILWFMTDPRFFPWLWEMGTLKLFRLENISLALLKKMAFVMLLSCLGIFEP